MNVIATGENRQFGRLVAQTSPVPSLHELFAHFHDEAIHGARNKVIMLVDKVYAWSDDPRGAGKTIHPNGDLPNNILNRQFGLLPNSGRRHDEMLFISNACIRSALGVPIRRRFGVFGDTACMFQTAIEFLFVLASLRKPTALGCCKNSVRNH